MNKIYSLFLLAIILCLGCSSDDNGTNPNNPNGNIVYDDWYWEFTFDTITYRCEGTYAKSGSSSFFYADLYNSVFQPNMPWASIYDQQVNFALQDKVSSSWIQGDVSNFLLNIPNPSAQSSVVTAYLDGINFGESIINLLETNGVTVSMINNIVNLFPNTYGTIPQPTNGIRYSEDADFQIDLSYTPGKWDLNYTNVQGTQFDFDFTASIGNSTFTLYFLDDNGQMIYSAPCSINFKAPHGLEYF